MKFLRLLPVQLVLCIGLALLVGNHLSTTAVQAFYTLSCSVKDILMFVLPVVIFSYITAAFLALEQRAPMLLLGVLGLTSVSTGTAVLASYGVSLAFLEPLVPAAVITTLPEAVITPLFQIPLPVLLSPDKALLIGITFGLLFTFVRVQTITTGILRLRTIVNHILRRFLTSLLPLYVFGFILKLQHEGSLSLLVQSYAHVFGLTLVFLLGYLTLLYWIGSGFSFAKTAQSIQNMLPAWITGFCTMSSAVTLPVTLQGTEKNLKNPAFGQLVIPTTVNIHMLGDALGLPMMGLAILLVNGVPITGFENYLIFTIYFCLAKFSAAAIPAGGVIVLLPVLQAHLGLTPEMLGLITTLYVLQDSIFTSANVMGNGAFAMIAERLLGPFLKASPNVASAPLTSREPARKAV